MKNIIESTFLKSAHDHPNKNALYVNEKLYTYSELNSIAQTYSKSVCASCDETEDLIGILAYRSIEMYAGIISILISGRGYVPIHPLFPISRLKKIISASKIKTIIVEKSFTNIAKTLHTELPHVTFLVADGESVYPPSDNPKDYSCLQKSIAYLLFTSGSTGEPKGVAIPHRNLIHYCKATQEKYNFTSDDRFTQLFDFTFDLSAFDLFCAWNCGGCVYSVPKQQLMAPAHFVQKHNLTIWFSVPSTAVLLAKLGLVKKDLLSSLRISLFCGEPLTWDTALKWATATPEALLENLYGPTEATISCTTYTIPPNATFSPGKTVPIGTPLTGTTVAIVAEDNSPVANGTIGELLLSGPQLAQGYWNDPDRTAQSFVKIDVLGDTIWYRTGDLAIMDEDSVLHHVGRIDHQVQISGFRVELEEIERIIREFCNTPHVVVAGVKDNSQTSTSLVAFISSTISIEDIIAHCKQHLPDYMIPKQFVVVDTMPLNSNGKIDRGSLLASLETSHA